MKRQPNPKIRAILEAAYRDFHSHYHRERDPVSLVHRYDDPRDQEVAGFLTALLSYGNVATILVSVGELLRALGPHPHAAVREWAAPRGLPRFRHRFTTSEDLEVVLHTVAWVLRRHGSLEAFFLASPLGPQAPMRLLLSDFVSRLAEAPLDEPKSLHRVQRERSLKYLLSDPLRGSACKRLNMWLRWMVRGADGVDLGLWSGLKPAQLVLPVDTHLLQTLRRLGWTRSKQATWSVAEEATDRLRLYAPEDPVRYDFALCHLSMCGGKITDYREIKEGSHAPME